jgi:hypothetical protein
MRSFRRSLRGEILIAVECDMLAVEVAEYFVFDFLVDLEAQRFKLLCHDLHRVTRENQVHVHVEAAQHADKAARVDRAASSGDPDHDMLHAIIPSWPVRYGLFRKSSAPTELP